MATEPITTMEIDRKPGQRIRLDLGDGRSGYITPLMRSNQYGKFVTLVIELPRSVSVDREEVYLKKSQTEVQENGQPD